eukprot:CAMPEP_0170614730 /NCGR_PEP_ID=MMETSP0224-20130122/24958_1 /TAXON_ID=285029 /ORGANISM="Togula jolla, Strain CCCM 725" /LENGTH=240 /DNA_ID=CAMNT_0010940411 /DNA_START=77 /DNA_END=799 /DNA_ORIENTATION=+
MEEELEECRILQGSTGVVVQGVLFACCVTVLFFKYHRNSGGRTFREFLLDSSKQLCGAGWVHILNLFFAQGLEKRYESSGDECEWYWINIVIDTTLGVAVSYCLLQIFTFAIEAVLPYSEAMDFRTGVYRTEDGKFHVEKFVKQLALWLLIISVMKILMVCCMMFMHGFFIQVAHAVLLPVSASPTLKLLAAMICTPFIMNTLQFWVTDNFLKKPESNSLPDDDMEMEGNMRTRIDHGNL